MTAAGARPGATADAAPHHNLLPLRRHGAASSLPGPAALGAQFLPERVMMKPVRALLALSITAAVIGLGGCKKEPTPTPTTGAQVTAPAGETADQFVARVNDEYRKMYPEMTAAQWLSSTYINDDSQLLSAKANERYLAQLKSWIEQANRFEGQQMSPETARAIQLLKLGTAMPPPKNPEHLTELTQVATKMEGAYGAGTYCKGEGDDKQCRQLGELEDVLRSNRDYDAQLDAWQGWHTVSQPMRKDYTRFVELVNEGARDMGFADAGEMWRSGYDMTPAEIAAETDRLWGQVKPLYEQLHCFARTRLDAKYGADKGHVTGNMLPAHLMGNMWQQDWGNLWDILAPYPNASVPDISTALESQYKAAFDAQLSKNPGKRSPDDLAQIEQDAKLATAKLMRSEEH